MKKIFFILILLTFVKTTIGMEITRKEILTFSTQSDQTNVFYVGQGLRSIISTMLPFISPNLKTTTCHDLFFEANLTIKSPPLTKEQIEEATIMILMNMEQNIPTLKSDQINDNLISTLKNNLSSAITQKIILPIMALPLLDQKRYIEYKSHIIKFKPQKDYKQSLKNGIEEFKKIPRLLAIGNEIEEFIGNDIIQYDGFNDIHHGINGFPNLHHDDILRALFNNEPNEGSEIVSTTSRPK